MTEPTKLFNFQLSYSTYEKLRQLGIREDCSTAKIVRGAIDLFFEKLNDEKGKK